MELRAILCALNEALETKERIIEYLRAENGDLTSRLRELERNYADLEHEHSIVSEQQASTIRALMEENEKLLKRVNELEIIWNDTDAPDESPKKGDDF